MLLLLLQTAQAGDMEAQFRFRSMSVPDGVLDAWFTDNDTPGAFDYKRPQVRASAFGGEFVYSPGPANLIGYVEYISSGVEEGYWDDQDSPQNFDDGDWIRPEGFGVIALGGNVLHEIPLLTGEAVVKPSVLFGGGLGLGFATGKLTNWQHGTNPDNLDPTCLPQSPSFARYEQCDPDGVKNVPAVVPMVDGIVAVKATVKDLVVVRFDAGLHTMLFWGFSVGGTF